MILVLCGVFGGVTLAILIYELNLIRVCGADVEGVVVEARFTSGRRARQRPPKQQSG